MLAHRLRVSRGVRSADDVTIDYLMHYAILQVWRKRLVSDI